MSSHNPSGLSSSALTAFVISFIAVAMLPRLTHHIDYCSIWVLNRSYFSLFTGGALVPEDVATDVATEYVVGGGEASCCSFVATQSSVSCGAFCVSVVSIARGSCAPLAYAPVAKLLPKKIFISR
jgi:hypothetical protein